VDTECHTNDAANSFSVTASAAYSQRALKAGVAVLKLVLVSSTMAAIL